MLERVLQSGKYVSVDLPRIRTTACSDSRFSWSLEHEIHRVALQDASPDVAAATAGYWKNGIMLVPEPYRRDGCRRVWLLICKKRGVTRYVIRASEWNTLLYARNEAFCAGSNKML